MMIPFPKTMRGQPAQAMASPWCWSNVRLNIDRAMIWLANRLGLPGAVQPVDMIDSVTGQSFSIRLGVFFTIISINGRDYYFHRLSGRFDGTGSAVSGNGLHMPTPPLGG